MQICNLEVITSGKPRRNFSYSNMILSLPPYFWLQWFGHLQIWGCGKCAPFLSKSGYSAPPLRNFASLKIMYLPLEVTWYMSLKFYWNFVINLSIFTFCYNRFSSVVIVHLSFITLFLCIHITCSVVDYLGWEKVGPEHLSINIPYLLQKYMSPHKYPSLPLAFPLSLSLQTQHHSISSGCKTCLWSCLCT